MRFHFECILTFGTVLMACLVTCVYLAANSVLSYKFHMRPQMSRQVSERVSSLSANMYNANFTSNKRVTKTQTASNAAITDYRDLYSFDLMQVHIAQ